jgi:hypothetical protein
MKKMIYLLLCLGLFATFISTSQAQEKKTDISDDEVYYDENYKGSDIIKDIFIDFGYGADKFGIGLGFRYWNLGASFGITGLGISLPDYDKTTYLNRTESVNTERYASIAVTTDLYYFYDFNEKYTVFANIGYAVGTDTILARKASSTDTRLYRWGSENNSEITFGLGVQYFFEKWIGLGVGYHTRRGIFAQFNYFWF